MVMNRPEGGCENYRCQQKLAVDTSADREFLAGQE
jgi:hypothetical protein